LQESTDFWTHNPLVLGSNPSGPTNHFNELRLLWDFLVGSGLHLGCRKLLTCLRDLDLDARILPAALLPAALLLYQRLTAGPKTSI
jgi:hypothetical protein